MPNYMWRQLVAASKNGIICHSGVSTDPIVAGALNVGILRRRGDEADVITRYSSSRMSILTLPNSVAAKAAFNDVSKRIISTKCAHVELSAISSMASSSGVLAPLRSWRRQHDTMPAISNVEQPTYWLFC